MILPPSDELVRIALICVGVVFGVLGLLIAGDGAWHLAAASRASATGFVESCALVVGWFIGTILSAGFAAGGALAVAMLPVGLWKLATYLTKQKKRFKRRQKLSI